MMPKPDPRSFPVAVLLTALVALGPISTDMYLPSLPDMTRAFGTTVSQVQLTLSVFIVGFACGMLIYGPLSDRFGRRPVLLLGIGIYFAASIACSLAPTIEALVTARFFQALGACAGPVIGRAVVRDVYHRDEAARMLSYMASAMALAPAIGPMLGGWLHTLYGWQANFVVFVLLSVLLFGLSWLMLDETNEHKDLSAIRPGKLVINYVALLKSRVFMGYALTVGLAFGGLFSFISGSSFVIIETLGLAPRFFGFVFAIVISGYMIGAFSAGRMTVKLGLDRVLGYGTILATLSGLVAAGLAWAGIVSIAAVVAPIAVYFVASALVIPNGSAGAMAPFPMRAGAVSALLGFLQMGMGAIAGWIVGLTFDGTTIPMTTSIAVCGAGSFVAYRFMVRGSDLEPEPVQAQRE